MSYSLFEHNDFVALFNRAHSLETLERMVQAQVRLRKLIYSSERTTYYHAAARYAGVSVTATQLFQAAHNRQAAILSGRAGRPLAAQSPDDRALYEAFK